MFQIDEVGLEIVNQLAIPLMHCALLAHSLFLGGGFWDMVKPNIEYYKGFIVFAKVLLYVKSFKKVVKIAEN